MQRQNNGRRTAKRQRGMALATTMLLMMFLMSVMLVGEIASSNGVKSSNNGLMSQGNSAMQLAAARTRTSTAFNMADSGIQYTLQWLGAQAAPPNNTAAFAPTGWGFTSAGGSPNRAKVVPDPSNPSNYFTVLIYPDTYNPGNTQKKYFIESVGYSDAAQPQIIQAYVAQVSLSQYLVLLNSWNDSNNYWVSGLTTFDGPVHDNNMGSDGKTNPPDGQAENILWTSAAGTLPMFTYTGSDAYSVSSPTGVSWWKDNFWTAGTPQIVNNANGTQTDQWLNVAAGGESTVKTGTPVVPFPTSTTLQKTAATGSATTLNPTGVTLCNGGGVYVEGNVNEMALSTSGTNNTNQVITVTQGTTVQRVTINPSTGQTTLETQQTNGTWLTSATMTGTTNGVVYVDGNVGSQGDPKTGGLHGMVADNVLDANSNITHNNALTIATPQADNCNLDGSILYNTQRQVAKDASGNPIYTDVNGNRTNNPANGTPTYVSESSDSNFTTKAGTLGVISNNVLVTKNDSSGNPLNTFYMDGTVLASGLYDADHFDSRPVGLWENMGGYLSSTVGTFGMFGGNNLLTNGFNTQFNYDARMRNTPPPYFPTTGSQYNIVSWQQVSQTLE